MKKRYDRLDIPLVVDKIGSTLKGLVIKNVRNEPGQGAKIFSVLREYDLRILFYLCSTIVGERTSIYLCLEIPGKEPRYEEISVKLRDATGAEEIIWEDYPVPGFSHQPFFPVMCFFKRGIFFAGHVLRSAFEGLRKRIGAPVIKVVLYHAGRAAGLDRAEKVGEERPDLTPKQLLMRFLLSGYAFGQYIGELAEWEEGEKAVIRVREGWESEFMGRGYEEPQCHFMRGFFEGFLSGIFGKEFIAIERRCECMGDDYCEFVLEVRDKHLKP